MGWGRVGYGKGRGRRGRVGYGWVWVGYIRSNYECFLINGCKDIDF